VFSFRTSPTPWKATSDLLDDVNDFDRAAVETHAKAWTPDQMKP